MKKEIEVKFVKNEVESKDCVLVVDLLSNTHNFGSLYIGHKYLRGVTNEYMLRVILDSLDFKKLLEIPEIKKLHDQKFKKEVDLFDFEGDFLIDNTGGVQDIIEYAKSYEIFRTANCIARDLFIKSISKLLDRNYNRFPTREHAENASVMSLDERKQFLWKIANGCALEEIETVEPTFSVYKNYCGKYVALRNTVHQNVEFKHQKDAQECADWLNGMEGDE